jgi:hypothetical protein
VPPLAPDHTRIERAQSWQEYLGTDVSSSDQTDKLRAIFDRFTSPGEQHMTIAGVQKLARKCYDDRTPPPQLVSDWLYLQSVYMF